MKLKKIVAGGELLVERVLRAILTDITFNFEKLETFPESISSSQLLSLNRAHKVYWVDTTAGIVTVTLPPAKACFGQFVNVRRAAGGNKVVIQADGSDTINGASTLEITSLYGAYTIISDGNTKWGIM